VELDHKRTIYRNPINRCTPAIFLVTVPIQVLDRQRHVLVFFVFSELR
jgi:hypothetical protein